MAWLSGLAGKAEEVLNTIDRSTAAVLKKDEGKRESQETTLLEVRSLPPDSNVTVEEFLRNEARYSNSKAYVDKKSGLPNKMTLSAPTTPAHGDRSLSLHSESIAWFDKATLNVDKKESILDTSFGTEYDDIESNQMSNNLITDEIQIELEDQNDFINLNGETELMHSSSLQTESTKLVDEQKIRAEYLKEIESFREKINTLTSERTHFLKEIAERNSALDKTRSELNSVECELEQHRARALKTLQERDKLISELRNNSGTPLEDTSVLTELNNLREERETLREENLQIREKLRLARQESIDADLSAEKVRQRAMEASIQARESVTIERRKRLDAEEEIKHRNEEIRSIREELALAHSTFSGKLQKQEFEISRLRSQLSAIGTPNSEVETRLTSLTRTLVLKQQELEHLTTERNALRLQLEKLEHEYHNWRKNLSFNNVNDTDDAKALLPSFLMESPFDTGVARRVKRAYSSLDAVGIRIGVFLRRYPLARIFVLIYMALLQFWVVIVLFSQSPEAH